jgi:hypothetical protein
MFFEEKVISQQTLDEHFSTGIAREARDLSPPLSDEAVHYITQVLTHFSHSGNLFSRENNTHSLPTLALLYQKAHMAPSRQQRYTILRQLGDSALFLGALFFEHFAKKGINKDYFIGMGGGAYGSLGDISIDNRHIYYELAETFPKLLQVVANVCTKEFNYDANDIFSLLERWQQSRDSTLRKQLQAIGITPMEFTTRH